MNKRLLFLMASLLLCGAVSAQNYWGDDPNSHAQPSNTPIVASVTIDGTAVTASNALRLGAFVGEELRGIAAQHTDGNFWIQVFYTDANDHITFKFYDGTDEYTTCETTLAGSEEGYGTPGALQVLNFTTTQTQSTQLASGWNWWSTPIEMNGVDGLSMLENSLGNNGEQIQSRSNGYVTRNEYYGYVYWSGSLTSILNEQMYMIQTNNSCNVSMSGQRASSSSHPITINNGWNWIGFPCSQSLSVSDAFQGFTPEANDQIKGRNSYATYSTYGSYGWWSGSLNSLEPGQGYMYMSNSGTPKPLTYQTSNRGENMIANITPNDNTFQPENDNYAFNMTVTAVVELDGEELRSEDYEIAAFAGNQCRGSVKLMYVEPLDRYEAFLLVFGDTEEPLHFVLTNGNDISLSEDHLMYIADGIVGTPTEPAILHFNPLGIDENNKQMVIVYPNPSNNVFNIEGNGIQKIEVIDNYGQIILSKEIENDFIQIDLNNNAMGVYYLRVVTNNGISINKLIKK